MRYTVEEIKQGGGMTDRLTGRGKALKDEIFAAEPSFSYEMAKLTREAYETYSEKPWPIQRAEALKHFFNNMTIYIRDRELLAGNRSEKLGALPRVPDEIHPVSSKFCERAPFYVEDGEERWENRFLFEEYEGLLSEWTGRIQEELVCGLAPGSYEGFGHIIADYEYIIRNGISGLLREVNERLSQISPFENGRRDFLNSVITAWTGVADWAGRYAALAEELAAGACGTRRGEELAAIAANCRRVPFEPAETFEQALQSFWFVHQAFVIEQKAGSISVSGLDRYLNEYLVRDIECGRLTWEKAEQLVENFMIKFIENAIWPVKVNQFAHLSLGGSNFEGKDTANELSFMIINAQMKIRSNTPLVSVRWHKKLNREFWLLAHRSIRIGTGLPSLYSDDKMIASLMSWGVPFEDAVNYGVVGCVEPSVMGETHGATLGGHLNLAKCLELAMNNGRTFMSQRQLGPDSGNLTDFRSIDDVIKAYTEQIENAVLHNVEMVNAAARAQRDRFGYPIMSALMHGCIERASDLTEGVNYNFPTVCVLGVTNVVDSLLALERFLFETGAFTAEELLIALRTNFRNREQMRQRLQSYPVKFGNGGEKPVNLYNRICAIHKKAVEKYSGPRGDNFSCGVWPVELHVRFGKRTGALPSGRREGEPLVDGVGACQGSDREGPTALVRNMADVNAVEYWPGGYTFNIKFNKATLESEEDLEKFADFTDTFFRLGGMQMQINTVSADTMRKAQADPAAYGDLVVRVAGFSTYFVGLGREVQDEIISRTAHG